MNCCDVMIRRARRDCPKMIRAIDFWSVTQSSQQDRPLPLVVENLRTNNSFLKILLCI